MSVLDLDDSGRSRPRRRRRWWIPLVVLLGLLLVAAGGVAVYANSIAKEFTSNLNHDPEVTLPEEDPTESAAPREDNGAVNIVLMGVDKRAGDVGRSDSLMLAHLSADRKSAYLISFPRDMWVDIPGRGKDKINAAYAYGGTALTVKTLQSMLGIKVDHVAQIDMEGFVELTDLVGGVTVTNEHAFSREGYDFPQGRITLADGKEALSFVRERKQLPNGDLDRAANQRKVVQAIVEKGLDPKLIANPQSFARFVGGVASTMHVDSGMTDDYVRDLVLSLRLNSSGMHQLQAPISGFGTSPGGASIDVVDETRLAAMGEALRKDTMADYLARYPD